MTQATRATSTHHLEPRSTISSSRPPQISSAGGASGRGRFEVKETIPSNLASSETRPAVASRTIDSSPPRSPARYPVSSG
ncbi:MAG: hypothetical protein ACYTAN_09245, partial [Planctomycetota bacterium]